MYQPAQSDENVLKADNPINLLVLKHSVLCETFHFEIRARTVVFSKHTVVCERNRKLCMVFRIGDMRHDNFIVSPALSVKVIRRRVTEEGEMYHEVVPLKIQPDSAEEPCIFLIWPLSVVHVIDENSPFYK